MAGFDVVGGTATSTATTNFDKTVQTIISTRLEELLRAPLPHLMADNFIRATHTKGSNKTLRFLNVPDTDVDDAEIAAALVQTEGEPNDAAAIAIGYEEFDVKQYMKTFRETDVSVLTSLVDIVAVTAERLARYVLVLLDSIAAKQIVTGTNVQYAGTGNSATNQVDTGDVMIAKNLKRAVATLETANVPRFGDGFYHCILHPDVKFDIELDSDAGGWIDASRFASPEDMLSGVIGRYAGIVFSTSSKARVKVGAGQSSNDVYSTTVFGPRFFAAGDFANNQTFVTPPGGHSDPGHQSALITWKGWLGVTLIGEGANATDVSGPRYVRIESASSL